VKGSGGAHPECNPGFGLGATSPAAAAASGRESVRLHADLRKEVCWSNSNIVHACLCVKKLD
jgi:hypothetical protein